MREIKFRKWDFEEKEMIPGDSLAFEEYASLVLLLSQEGIMQYTGVHDDDDGGNEIYESDIIELEDDDRKINCIVKYEGGAFLLVSDELLDGYELFTELHEFDRSYCWLRNCRVIGNIYTNPELLEG